MNHYATIRAALESIRTCDDDIGERDAALSALAELEKAASVVVDYQYWHGDCWRGKQTWNGNTATVSRALYAAPPAIAAATPVPAVEVSHYNKDRDNAALGKFYTDHVSAMTREGLHAKSDIASELAARDAEIAELRRDAERYRWLRDQGGLDLDAPWCVFQGKDWHGRSELDTAIDAARGRE